VEIFFWRNREKFLGSKIKKNPEFQKSGPNLEEEFSDFFGKNFSQTSSKIEKGFMSDKEKIIDSRAYFQHAWFSQFQNLEEINKKNGYFYSFEIFPQFFTSENFDKNQGTKVPLTISSDWMKKRIIFRILEKDVQRVPCHGSNSFKASQPTSQLPLTIILLEMKTRIKTRHFNSFVNKFSQYKSWEGLLRINKIDIQI